METLLWMLLCFLVLIILYFGLGAIYLRLFYGYEFASLKQAVLYILQDLIENYEQIFECD